MVRETLQDPDGWQGAGGQLFERARELGVPLRPLLHERASQHRLAGRLDAAFECYTLLDAWQPGAVFELLVDASDEMLLRLSPWVLARARSNDADAATCNRVKQAMVRAWGDAGARAVLSQLERSGQSDPECGGFVAKAVACVADAAKARAQGEPDREHRLMEEAFHYRIPLPHVLRACGRYFKHERDDYAKAYECYAALEQIEPDDFIEYSRGLPPAVRCRHAPATMTRMLRGSRPAVYHLRPTKAALVQTYGPWAAAATIAQCYGADHWQLRQLPVRSMQDHARAHALEYKELIPPADVKVSVPAVWGYPRPASVQARSRSMFCCVLQDVVVTGKSNVLRTREAMLLDYQGDELARIPVDFDVNPNVVAGDESELTVLELEGAATKPALDAAFSLAGLNTSNFGHWVFEYMFQVWALMQRPGFASLALIIDQQMPRQLREMLEFFAGTHHPVVVLGPGESVHVRRLWACSKIAYWPGGERPSGPVLDFEVSDTPALARLIGTLQPHLDAAARDGYPQHIYLTRGADQSRPLTNRPEVEKLFGDKGFTVLNFNHMPYLEQVRHLRAARTVIMEAGSAVYGLLVCRAGTRVGEIIYDNPTDYEWFSAMFESLGLDLLRFPCASEEVSRDVAGALRLTVDLGELEAFVDGRLAAQAASASRTS